MTTLNLQVAASTDDADEQLGTMDLVGSTIVLAGFSDYAGVRVTSVTIPAGATVDSCIVQIYCTVDTQDFVVGDLYCDDADDAATFSSDDYDISDRDFTTAKVTENESSGVGTGWWSFSDAKALVQEVVNRGGLSSAGLAFLWDHNSSDDLKFRAYDGETSQAAKVDIDYTAAAGIAGPLVDRTPLGSLVYGGLAG